MRRIALVLGVAAALAAVALTAAAILLPRYVDDPAVRARIAAAVKEASGRELTYASLTAGLLPPRLEVKDPAVAGDAPGAPPLFAADSVALRISWLPLLTGALVLDSLDVDGARIHVVRTPPQPEAATPGGASAAPAGPAEAPAPSSAPRLGVERLNLAGARITFEDRTVSPPATVVLQDLDVKARRAGVFDPVSFDASARLASGGQLSVRGTVSADAALDATVTLASVDTRAFAPWLEGAKKPKRLSGLLGGTISAKAEGRSPKSVEADLVLDDADVEIEDVRLLGKLAITADLAPVAGGLGGAFQIDATQADLAYANAFRKPAGTAATTSGTLKPGTGGALVVDELHVKIKNLDAHGSLRAGTTTEIALDAEAFDLAGWEALLPALSDVGLGGRLALSGLRATTAPTRLTGAVVFDDTRLAAKGQPPVTLRGRVVGAGDAIRSEALALDVAGQPVALDVSVAPLSGAPVGSFVATGRDIESSALLGAFSQAGAQVSGPLRFDARFRAPLAGERPLLQALSGTLDFSIAPGRFRGVSMLKDTIERSGPVVQAAVAAGQAFGGRDVKRMYSDEFQSLSANAKLSGGIATFDPLRIVHDAHRVDVRGRVNLETRALDASGQISFPNDKSAGAMRGQTLLISHIGGTVDRPRVELSPEDVALVAAKVGGSAIERNVEGLLDKLGGQKGGSPLDAIQGFLGGKRKN